MFSYNYHTHTYRCGHASGKDEEYVLAALEAGFKVLGFSDHAPYRHYSVKRNHMEWEDLDGYIESILSLKEKYKDRIEILLGLESEYYPQCLDEKKQLREKLDYMILGQHFDTPAFDHVSYFHHNSEEEIRQYTNTVIQGLQTGLFTYLCHPDVFMSKQEDFTQACQEAAHRLGKVCEELKIPMEVNLRGILKGKTHYQNGELYPYPHKDFWRIIATYHVPVVVGFDAHDPNELRMKDLHEKALEELKDLSLDYITKPFIQH